MEPEEHRASPLDGNSWCGSLVLSARLADDPALIGEAQFVPGPFLQLIPLRPQ